MAAPCCGTCQCFDPPKAAAGGVDVTQHVYRYGTCLRFPQSVQKMPGERCFEHRPGKKG